MAAELVEAGGGLAPTADPLARLKGIWAQPAVVAARPAIYAAVAAVAGLLMWLGMQEPTWRPLYSELSDGDKAAVMLALEGGNYQARINPQTGTIEVPEGEAAAARILLAGQGLPQSARALDPVGDMPLGMSRAVEAARLKSALAGELAASIEAIDGVKRATVHVALPEPSVFVRDKVPASASVFVSLAPGRVLGEAQVRAIVWLVSSSVAGLAPERVSVVDQSGALLSQGVAAGEAAQLGYQARLEGLMRERLNALLTPLIGARRFTAEVAADVDFSTSEAASERFERDGSVLRSEQASRSSETSPVPARGVPGALTNTAPAAAQVAATPPQDTAAAPGAEPQLVNESTNRAWEIGKDVRVTRGGAPRLVRLSVAVVIDRAALARDGKVAPDEVASLQRIIEGAVGHDRQRGDRVEVVLRDFAALEPEPEAAWFEKPVVRDYAPLGLVALLVLVGGGYAAWRWRKNAKAKVAAEAAALRAVIGQDEAAGPVDGGDLSAAPVVPGLAPLLDYSGKLGATRELVTGDTDRATAVARMMLADDAALGEDAA